MGSGLTSDRDAAEAEYIRATNLAPQDPEPLSSLSSVKFELGQYSGAVEYILKCLELADKTGDRDAPEAAKKRKRCTSGLPSATYTSRDGMMPERSSLKMGARA